ncbi:C-X-C chemokine receptor type 2-like [Heterodontus francisci]|uniref:C-X-C chemokine receptor type 2-like n=1 Tax=Heterodontus francisci TaxID=7792 RepID=UPI00355B61F9
MNIFKMFELITHKANSSDNNDFPDNLEDFSPCPQINQLNINYLVIAIIYSIVSILAVAGNSVVVMVILSAKYVRSSTDIYILNLTLSDLLFAFTLPFWAVYIVDGWIFGNFMCKAISVLQEVNFYSGILLLVCISVDRYLAIVCAIQYISSKRYLVKYICAAVWTVGIALSLPILLFRSVFVTSDTNQTVCYNHSPKSSDNWRIGIRIVHHSIGFIIPLAIMLFCYGSTMKTLFRTRSHQKHKAMKVIIAVVLGFLICWLPYNVTVCTDTLLRASLISDGCNFRTQFDRVFFATQSLAFMHCCINPILYAFIGQKFRHHLVNLLYDRRLISQETATRYERTSAQGSGRESMYSSSTI